MKKNSELLLILTFGVFGILNTEMGIIGVLPAVAERYGIDIVQAGLLVSMFALVIAFAGPTMPLLLSRFNRKKVMLFVLGVFTICNSVSVFAPTFEILLAARIIPAFFHPVYCALAFSTAAASVPPEQAPRATARINMGVAAGMVIGVPISNFLAGQFSLSAAMAFFAVVTGVMFILTAWRVPSLPVHSAMSYGRQVRVLRRPNVWLSIFAVLFLNGSIFGVYNYLADYLGEITHASTNMSVLLLALYGIMNVAGSYMAGGLLTKRPIMTVRLFPVILIGLYLCFLGGLGTAVAPMIVLLFFWGLLAGINANINQYWLARAIPEAPDFGNGLFLTAANLGCMLATTFCGHFIHAYGIYYVIVGGIFFAIAAGILFWAQTIRLKIVKAQSVVETDR